MKQLKSQAPNAVCEVVPWNIPRQLLVNRDKPPFDNPELRRAMALTLDRKAFIDILSDGRGLDRRRDDAAAGRQLGHAAGGAADSCPGYGPDVAEEPRRGPRDHEKARLRPGQAAADHGDDPQRRRPIATRRCC